MLSNLIIWSISAASTDGAVGYKSITNGTLQLFYPTSISCKNPFFLSFFSDGRCEGERFTIGHVRIVCCNVHQSRKEEEWQLQQRGGIQPKSKKSERSPSAESAVTIWIDRLNVPWPTFATNNYTHTHKLVAYTIQKRKKKICKLLIGGLCGLCGHDRCENNEIVINYNYHLSIY
jgi:hypothetical protein